MIYPYQIALGLLAILTGVLLVRVMYRSEDLFHVRQRYNDLRMVHDYTCNQLQQAQAQLADLKLPPMEFEPMEAPMDGWVQVNIGAFHSKDYHGEAAHIVLRMEDGTEAQWGKKLVAVLHKCTEL